MHSPPKVFISAASGDLRTVRQIVKEALLTINCHPVEQTNFEPDWRTVEGMLRAKIEGCQALIHIAGMRYGAEPDPASLPDGAPRRSYTQMEYHLGCQLHEQRGDDGFRVYTFICPENFPYDGGAEAELEEKVKLQREHRAQLMDNPRLYEIPGSGDELKSRVLALQEQVLTLTRQQAEVKAEVVKGQRFNVKAFAVIGVLLALVLGGVWSVVSSQREIVAAVKFEGDKIRSQLREASERKLAVDLAEADKKKQYSVQQKLREAAQAAEKSRDSRNNEFADELKLRDGQRSLSPIALEMTRILQEEGVDKAIKYIELKKSGILASDEATAVSGKEKRRANLLPLLYAAKLQESKGETAAARATYEELIKLDAEWPQLLYDFGYFLRDQAVYKESCGDTQTALVDAEFSLGLAKGLSTLEPQNKEYLRLLSAVLLKLGALATARRDFDGATRYFAECRKIRESLLDDDRDDLKRQRDLFVLLCSIGDLAILKDDKSEAKQCFTEGNRISERLVANDAKNKVWQRDHAISLEKLGGLALNQENMDDAERYFTKSQTITENLLAIDRGNIRLRRDLSHLLILQGDLAMKRRSLSKAESHYVKCKGHIEEFCIGDSTEYQLQGDLWKCYERLGTVCERSQRPEEAKNYWSKAYEVLRNMKSREMYLSQEDLGFLDYLRAKLGN